MAEKNPQQKRLIAERVRALAIVYLTRRPDVTVREVTDDIGIDLLAYVMPEEDRVGLRQFGVELRGVWAAVTADHANKVLGPSMKTILRYGPFPFPVVLFFFTMEDNQGWYTWAAEPIVSSDGEYELCAREDASCQPLDDRAVDEIVARVNRWYDAYYAQVSSGTVEKA